MYVMIREHVEEEEEAAHWHRRGQWCHEMRIRVMETKHARVYKFSAAFRGAANTRKTAQASSVT